MFRLHGRLGEFELIRVLASSHGSSGMVCLAVHATTGVPAAIKMISRAADDVEALIDAERDGAMLQERLAFRSDAVPRIYDCGEHDDVFYIAMEYVDGVDLEKQIGNGVALPPLAAARILADVCGCLTVAHAPHHLVHGARRSIVHGDVTPANIRVTPSGRAKLLDFGAAKTLDANHRCAFSTYLTVQYASPERIESGAIDVHSDLWAAGIVLYEAIAGRRPWERVHTRGHAEWPSHSRSQQLPSTCPATLARIATRATDPKLSDRYASAAAIFAALEQFLFAQRSNERYLSYSIVTESCPENPQ